MTGILTGGILTLAGVIVGHLVAGGHTARIDARLYRELAPPGPRNLDPPSTAELDCGHAGHGIYQHQHHTK